MDISLFTGHDIVYQGLEFRTVSEAQRIDHQIGDLVFLRQNDDHFIVVLRPSSS